MEKNLESLPHDQLLTVILIGDQSVGKTSLIQKFVKSEDQLSGAYKPTIGLDFKTKKVLLNGRIVKLTIWDTAGQERFRTISQTYYQRADGVILAYDCTSASSYASISNWITQIQEHSKQNVQKVLVATKVDDA